MTLFTAVGAQASETFAKVAEVVGEASSLLTPVSSAIIGSDLEEAEEFNEMPSQAPIQGPMTQKQAKAFNKRQQDIQKEEKQQNRPDTLAPCNNCFKTRRYDIFRYARKYGSIQTAINGRTSTRC